MLDRVNGVLQSFFKLAQKSPTFPHFPRFRESNEYSRFVATLQIWQQLDNLKPRLSERFRVLSYTPPEMFTQSSHFLSTKSPLSSNRQHSEINDCLEDNSEDYFTIMVNYLCTVARV